MHRRPFRASLSVLLAFALLSMLPPCAVMAMPMTMSGAAQQMSKQHDMERIADHHSLDHAASRQGQHDRCHCGGHCGLCGVCYSTLSSTMGYGFTVTCMAPAGLPLSRLVEIYLSPDPYPPRA